MPSHEAFMAQAIKLAERGLNSTMPNPRVGCILVKNGNVIAEGWHITAGQGHAEVNALSNASEDVSDADVYVTLEPCCHTGRTSPCSQALINSKVKHVYIACLDPNPKVAGSGVAQLEAAGIKTTVGLCAEDAERLNLGFNSRMTKHRPYVRLKLATSLDGKTTAASGESQWITGQAARIDVQKWRARSCAIVTGVETIIADNPRLTVRSASEPRLKPLIRVIVDSSLRTPPGSTLLSDNQGSVWVYSASESNSELLSKHAQVELKTIAAKEGRVDLSAMLTDLATNEVNEVWVECGQTLASTLLEEELVDELIHYVAPCLLGDDGRGMVKFQSRLTLNERLNFQLKSCRQVGDDLRLQLTPVY